MPTVELKNVPLLQGLSQSEFEDLSPCFHEKSFSEGSTIFTEGMSCQSVFIVKSGRIKVYRTASSGREQILEILNPGDTCACNPGNADWFCSSSGEAVTACVVWSLSRPDYLRLIQSNLNLSNTLNDIFARRLRCFSNLIEEVSLKDVKKRLIKFLIDMLDEKKKEKLKNDALFIPFTREELAQRLGTSRETVTRYLSQLNKSGLIDVKPYQIIIRDLPGLKELLNP